MDSRKIESLRRGLAAELDNAGRILDGPGVILGRDRVVEGERAAARESGTTARLSHERAHRGGILSTAKNHPHHLSRAKRTGASAESVFAKPSVSVERRALERIAKRPAAGDGSNIDYPGIASLTDSRLAPFRRPPKALAASGRGRSRLA